MLVIRLFFRHFKNKFFEKTALAYGLTCAASSARQIYSLKGLQLLSDFPKRPSDSMNGKRNCENISGNMNGFLYNLKGTEHK